MKNNCRLTSEWTCVALQTRGPVQDQQGAGHTACVQQESGPGINRTISNLLITCRVTRFRYCQVFCLLFSAAQYSKGFARLNCFTVIAWILGEEKLPLWLQSLSISAVLFDTRWQREYQMTLFSMISYFYGQSKFKLQFF